MVKVTFTAADPLDDYPRDWDIFEENPGKYLGGFVWEYAQPIMSQTFFSGDTWTVDLPAGTYYFMVGQSGGNDYGVYSGTITIGNDTPIAFDATDADTVIQFTIPQEQPPTPEPEPEPDSEPSEHQNNLWWIILLAAAAGTAIALDKTKNKNKNKK